MGGEIKKKMRRLKESEEVECPEMQAEPIYAGDIGDEEFEKPLDEEDACFALIFSFAYEGPGRFVVRTGGD